MTKAKVSCLTLILSNSLQLRDEILNGPNDRSMDVIQLPYYSDNTASRKKTNKSLNEKTR